LLTVEEAAELLSVPVSWLKKRVANHAVPCTRLGRHIRFTREQLAGIVEAAADPAAVMPLTGLTRRSRRTA
jgi:excisionase family DNA binding protein